MITLDEAVARMLDDRPAYEPALELIADQYGVDIEIDHHNRLAAE